jgi:hypothetical protein
MLTFSSSLKKGIAFYRAVAAAMQMDSAEEAVLLLANSTRVWTDLKVSCICAIVRQPQTPM